MKMAYDPFYSPTQTKPVNGLRLVAKAHFHNVDDKWLLDFAYGERASGEEITRRRMQMQELLVKVVTDTDSSVLGNKTWQWDDAATALRAGFDQVYAGVRARATTRATTNPASTVQLAQPPRSDGR